METRAFDIEQSLLELPGSPERWVWAFPCPVPDCRCREVVVLTALGDREILRVRGRPVADAWHAGGRYVEAAEGLPEVAAFALDLDTLDVLGLVDDPLVDGGSFDLEVEREVKEFRDRLDDDLLDEIARSWYLGKGKQLPPEPGAGGGRLEIEGWRPGDLVPWDAVGPALRSDIYILGDRSFKAVDRYCVAPDCRCSRVVVDFRTAIPRGAPHPGEVELDGEVASFHPAHERQRGRLVELWAAYVERHPRYPDRLERRRRSMHELAGRITAPPPKRRIARNEPCPCGSGRKFKMCCGKE